MRSTALAVQAQVLRFGRSTGRSTASYAETKKHRSERLNVPIYPVLLPLGGQPGGRPLHATPPYVRVCAWPVDWTSVFSSALVFYESWARR